MVRRVRRSGMTMPINNPRFVNASWTRNCDYLNFDLEDSVPQAQKAHARTLVRDAIAAGQKGGAEITLRTNVASPEADVDAACWPGMKQLNNPKAETREQIQRLDRLITEKERLRGIRPGTVRIGANLETALGTANCYEIASASPRIDAFSGGAGYDMSLDMGIEMFVGFDQHVYNRCEGELVALALGLERGGGVYLPDTTGSVSNAERAVEAAVANRKAGFRSGGGLHPAVVQPQNEGLTPPPEEVEQAHRVLAYFRELGQRGEVAGELDGQTVDAYEAARAEGLIGWADACARRDAEKARAREETIAREGPPSSTRR